MKRLLILLLLLTFAACTQGTVPNTELVVDPAPQNFGTSGTDTARALAKHSNGVYVVGFTLGNLYTAVPKSPNGDAFIGKYAANGDILWGRQFGSKEFDLALGVASDGSNAYVVGLTYGNLKGTNQGNADAFIRKYNTNGKLHWSQQFGTGDHDEAASVASSGSSIYVVGTTGGNLSDTNQRIENAIIRPNREDPEGIEDAFIRKYNSNGSIAWTRQFGTPDVDVGSDVAVDDSGNVYVVGTTYGSLRGSNGGGADMFIRKYSPSGNVLWTKQRHYSTDDRGLAVAVSGSHVYLVGTWWFNNSPSNMDVRVVKYTTGGSLVWDRSYGLSGREHVTDASADSMGNLYIAGFTTTSFAGPNQGGADGYVIKLDPNGNSLWSKQIGTSDADYTFAVLVRTDGQVYAAGRTHGQLGFSKSGNGDAYLMRLRGSNGSTVWTDQ